MNVENCRLEETTPDAYDLIIVSGLLHEVEDEDIFLQSLRMFCTPETLVHVNVPNAFSFHRLLVLEMGLIDSVHQLSETNKRLQQPRVFDLEMLKSAVERNGFRVEDSGAYLFKPFPHAMMENLISAGFLTDGMLEGFYLMDKYFTGVGSEIFVNCRLRAEQTVRDC